jgi:hypothetical protein
VAEKYQVSSQSFSPYTLPDVGSSALAGVIAGVCASVRNNLHHGSLFVDPYWVGFYVTNFQDGFRSRAFIGTLCRMLFPDGVSVVTVNIVSFVIAFALMGLLLRSFVRLSAPSSLGLGLFTFAFFSSTLTSNFIETAGDMLQVAFVIFLGLFLLTATAFKSDTSRLIAGLLLIGLSFFIHDASMFFLVPALPFLLRNRPRLADFIVPSLLLVMLATLSIHWSNLQPSLTYQAIPFPHDRVLSEPIAIPDFKGLLRAEAAFDFGSLHNTIRFASKLLRLFVLLFAGIIALAHCFPPRIFERFLRALSVMLLYNAPLWFVAHDWGRFLAYTFFFAIIVSAAHPVTATDSQAHSLSSLSAWIRSTRNTHAIPLSVLFVLFTSHTLFSRITGIGVRPFVAFLVIVLFLKTSHTFVPVSLLDTAQPQQR